MGRKKVFDGKLVPIGAKVTEEQMREIDSLKESLGMKSRSELYRAALVNYLRKHPENIGYSGPVTNQDESSDRARVSACRAFKELGISLKDAITKFELLDECTSPDSCASCSMGGVCSHKEKPKDN